MEVKLKVEHSMLFMFSPSKIEKVVNFEYSNFENLTSKKCLKSGELSSPLSAYSYSYC